MNSKSAIKLDCVGKKYPLVRNSGENNGTNVGDFWALRDISIEIGKGQIAGIIGRNGSGKTTLLNIIAGVLSATEGTVLTSGKVVGLFNLGAGFQDELTGRENIFLNGSILGASRKELNEKLRDIMDFSELDEFINMPLGTYSQGMRLRLGFSIIANLDFDILVIDEVLAVGDIMFQNKCFERLMDFKRNGKTLIITSQNTKMIERLSDQVLLLEHGRAQYFGNPQESSQRYFALMRKESFSVGSTKTKPRLFEDTKKWAEDKSAWNMKFGTREVVIDNLELINESGARCERVESGGSLTAKISFTAKNAVKRVHFGLAIFRKDGVYCHGPNTAFDGHKITKMEPGEGFFSLHYDELLLAPGDYLLSAAVWDHEETLPFDHHYTSYKLSIRGPENTAGELLNMPFHIINNNNPSLSLPNNKQTCVKPNIETLTNKWEQKIEHKKIIIECVKISGPAEQNNNTFFTGEQADISVRLNNHDSKHNNLYLWLGLYRDDKIYCQGITQPLTDHKEYMVRFPKFLLLPGQYRLSAGIWNPDNNCFEACHHGLYPFKMVFDLEDHGTVYMDHQWEWKLPS